MPYEGFGAVEEGEVLYQYSAGGPGSFGQFSFIPKFSGMS